MALCGLAQGQVGCGVMQETKLTDWVYTMESSEFWVTATAAPITHFGGVTVFYCKSEHLAIEDLCLHGTKVIRFQMVTGKLQWHIAGCYIAPRDASTIEDVAEATRDLPYGADLLVSGDLNSNL